MTGTNRVRPDGDRLSLLYRLSQTFNSSLDLDEVLDLVMDEIIAVTRAERGFVMLQETGGKLVFRVARGLDHGAIEDPQFQVSRSVVDRVAQEGQPILTNDAQSDDRFSARQSVMSLGLRSILCVPLNIKDSVLGVVYVDNRFQCGIFDQADLDLLAAIASSAAIAIENARLYQVAIEKGRLERELQVAHEVQVGLLPHGMPQIPGWEIATEWRPARDVAGDFYDFIPLDGQQLGLVIADVSDKGMPAALFMALTRSIVRASMGHAPSPAVGITHANRLICDDATGGMFVTLFYAQLNPATGACVYVNAGHNPPLLFRQSDQPGQEPLTELTLTGGALGVAADWSFGQRSIHLDPGDFLLLYTDGVTDATDAQGQFFGLKRLRRLLVEHGSKPAGEILVALERAVDDFVGPTVQFDDIAILVAKRQ